MTRQSTSESSWIIFYSRSKYVYDIVWKLDDTQSTQKQSDKKFGQYTQHITSFDADPLILQRAELYNMYTLCWTCEIESKHNIWGAAAAS